MCLVIVMMLKIDTRTVHFARTPITRGISRFMWSFNRIELGEMVEGIVVDLNARSSPIPSEGLETKLKLYFRHTELILVS